MQLFQFFRNYVGVPVSAPDPEQTCFSMPSSLTVRTITAVHQELLQFIDQNKATTIAFEAESQLDVSAVQLLEAARIFAGTGGKSIALAQPATGALLEILRRSGFLEGMSPEDAQFWLHQREIQ